MSLYSDDGRSFWRVGARNEALGLGNTVTIFIADEPTGTLSDTIYTEIVAAVRNVLVQAGGSNNWAQRTDAVITPL